MDTIALVIGDMIDTMVFDSQQLEKAMKTIFK